MNNDTKGRRFAALIRVSTEKQEKEGESLRTQTSDIERSIKEWGGQLSGWYGGQEHATPGHEKKEIDRLLGDAANPNRTFDAVIVAHADRWSRDNTKSHEGLEAFRKHGVRFYVGLTEYDLFKPEHCLFLEMSAVFGQFQARQQNLKSITSRISKARRGLPTCGKLPFGRTRDKKTGRLVIDLAKQQVIHGAATRYLAGEQLPKIARELGMNASNLHKILTKRCGSEWQIEFQSVSANVHEIVKFEIPPLLEAEMIRAIQRRIEANRTYSHGQRRDGHKYLLCRMIFCAHCGYAMFGQTNHDGRRYYRHTHSERDRPCHGPLKKPWIRAEVIEDTVMCHLFETFGNPKAMQRAIESATPDFAKVKETVARIEKLSAAIVKARKARDRVVQLVADELLSIDNAKPQLKRLDEQEQGERTELGCLQSSIAHLPTRDAIKEASEKIAAKARSCRRVYTNARLLANIRHANDAFDEMSWDDKRALAQMVFGGTRPDGSRMGVYIEWFNGTNGHGAWRYSIHGHLIDEENWPLRSLNDNKEFFSFGSASRQRELVTKHALH